MRRKLGCIAAAILALAGSTGRSAEPPGPGTISVEAVAVDPALRSSMPAFVEAVGRTLAAREFTVLSDPGHARYVADLKLIRVAAGTTIAKVPVEGPSARSGTASRSVGASLDIALPTAKTKTVPLQQIRLEVGIRRRGEPSAIWHGSAMTVRAPDSPGGKDDTVARDLSEAIFRAYPAQSESLISVP